MNVKQLMIDPVGRVTITRNRQASKFKIAIKPDGEVRVTIPWLASFRSGESFVAEHLQWITQTREKLKGRSAPGRLILPGHLFSTRHYHYWISPANVKCGRIRYLQKDQKVFFEYPENQPVASEEVQKHLLSLIENMLRFEAKKYLPGRISELASSLGYSFQRITIKNNKTNWGSCSNRKNINLNLHLMRLSDRLIDFVIVHELVHTVIPNHGPDFKAAMKHHFADADQLDRELKKFRTAIFTTSEMQ